MSIVDDIEVSPGAMANGRFDEKGPLIGDLARHVDDGAVSFGFQVLLVL